MGRCTRFVKRPASTALALIALVAGNTLLQSCQTRTAPAALAVQPAGSPAFASAAPAASPTPPAASPTLSTASPTAPPTSSQQPALWILDGRYTQVVAVDAQTGNVLSRNFHQYPVKVTSTDGHWQYALETPPRKDKQWKIVISQLDLIRGVMAKQIELAGLATSSKDGSDDLPRSSMALSPDSRLLYVTQAGKTADRWITRVHIVDTASARPAPPLDIFAGDVQDGPPELRSVASADGRRLFVLQNSRQGHAAQRGQAPWTTRIAILNTAERRVERSVDVPGEIQADGFWLNAALSPDGRMLYLIQHIVRGNTMEGYRFVAFDTRKLAVDQTRHVERVSGGEPFCDLSRLRFTPDGRYLFGYCSRDPDHPHSYFQFLDTRTGLVAEKLPFESKSAEHILGEGLTVQMIAPPDSSLLYVANVQSKEVSVVDLRRRVIVRSTVVRDPRPVSAQPWRWLEGWFASTASAKMLLMPGVVLSADGRRLYFVDVVDFETGNGIWGVDTSSLTSIGHWLAGKEIAGLQLSADGRRLYAVSPNDHTLYALDAFDGQILHAFDKVLSQPAGFAAAAE